MSETPNWDAVCAAFKESKALQANITGHRVAMAEMLLPNLRALDSGLAAKLKRALADFNLKTHCWKS